MSAAGSDVVIPLYSSVLPFFGEARSLLYNAVLLQRPSQNLESDTTALKNILTELREGKTTALLAAKADLEVAVPKAGLSFVFNLSDIASVQTNVVLPVGAWLPLPGAMRT